MAGKNKAILVNSIKITNDASNSFLFWVGLWTMLVSNIRASVKPAVKPGLPPKLALPEARKINPCLKSENFSRH